MLYASSYFWFQESCAISLAEAGMPRFMGFRHCGPNFWSIK